jgi:hypothetical protein
LDRRRPRHHARRSGPGQRGGAAFIDACQTLSDANTTYKLTTDLTSCTDCLVVANDKITIDLQGHSLPRRAPRHPNPNVRAVTDQRNTFNVITIKNGFVSRYDFGVFLQTSTRVSVLAVTASNNGAGIVAGPQSLVKGSEAFRNRIGSQLDLAGQVQQSNSHDNGSVGIYTSGDNCLITASTANGNVFAGILVESRGARYRSTPRTTTGARALVRVRPIPAAATWSPTMSR